MLSVRSFASRDAEALGEVFHRAVHEGAAGHYDDMERAAWSPVAPSGAEWAERLGDADTVVAERDGRLVGMMSYAPERAYLDLAYVLPEEMGRGTAKLLYAVVEGRARVRGLGRLVTEASHLAQPFFARRGFSVVRRQTVERRGVRLENAVMAKTLGPLGAVA